ncbi:tRNA(fMet)-specific endonuclease VapC [Pseudonocardia eucalypti]|uniref:PIN domain-containing protein n=1 Tax=Pseudonocardia eucalypti TaxID=648755 RepID=UPI0017F4A07D|nr:tRNA(fMet)-specific endonuclease VapC [Pseudonocardia eucalypti]
MSSYLLDTNVLSEAARPAPDSRVLARLAEVEGNAAISAVTWHELRFGVRRLPPCRRRDALEVFVSEVSARFPVIPYDERAASWHAVERARLEQAGFSRAFADGQIAATAATNALVLVTRNTADFAGFSGLMTENWWTNQP